MGEHIFAFAMREVRQPIMVADQIAVNIFGRCDATAAFPCIFTDTLLPPATFAHFTQDSPQAHRTRRSLPELSEGLQGLICNLLKWEPARVLERQQFSV